MSLQLFRSREASIPLFFAACAGAALLLAGACANAATLSGNATLTSDYVWRGTTQTQGDAAVQAGFKLAGDSGFYGSIWGSNVEFAPETHASSELDFTVGWGRQSHRRSAPWTSTCCATSTRRPRSTSTGPSSTAR